MSNPNASAVAAMLAAKVNTQQANHAEQIQKTDPAVEQATKEQEVDISNIRVFHGEFPISVSMMTSTGVPIHFYQGFHVTEDQEVIEFLKKEKTVKDITGKIKLADIPRQPERSRNRNWAAASKFGGGDPTVFSPTELLKRAVAGSNTLSTAAQSNG